MWAAVVTTSDPAEEPVTLADVKSHLRVDVSDDDSLIGSYIAAARGHVEHVTGTRLVTQTVVCRCNGWDDLASLPIGPVQSITSIGYTDTDGAGQTLSTDVYDARLYGLEPKVALKYGQVWPPIQTGSLIAVTAVVGYGAAGDQPPAVLQAVKMIVLDMYDHRGTAGDAPHADVMANADGLLENHRIYVI